MKKLITLVLVIFLYLKSFSQERENKFLDSSLLQSGILKLIDSSVITKHGFLLPLSTPSKILFFGKEINSEILIIEPNGNIFYKPSAFCSCKACKKYKGMKFLKNIFKPNY